MTKRLSGWKTAKICLMVLQIAMFLAGVTAAALTDLTALPTNLIIDVGLECMGMLLLLLMFISGMRSMNQDHLRSQFMLIIFCTAVYLFLDEISELACGKAGLRILVIASNTGVYCFSIILAWMFWFFAREWNGEKNTRTSFWTANTIALLGLALVLGDLHFHYYYHVTPGGLYMRNSWYWLSLLCPLLLLGISAINVIRHRGAVSDKVILLSFPTLPLLASVYSAMSSVAIPLNVLAFCSVFSIYSNLMSLREKEYEQQQAELKQTRVNLMISQMHPHFISNTMGMIRSMYRSNPKEAEKAMNTFISYLQRNFSELSSTVPISAEKEIEHVREFAQLEMLRWPDIEFVFDIHTVNFFLPPLTLQPLVENAVRHGIMPLRSGGCVTISTWEGKKEYRVRVEDNGVGFDTTHPVPKLEDHRKHIGIPNIRDRLEGMCNGWLEIQSTPGKGTVATVFIPKEVEK